MTAPCIQPVVDGEMRKNLQSGRRGGSSNLIERRIAQNLVRDPHGLLLNRLNLALFLHHFAPAVDLLMNVNLHGRDVDAAAIQSRRKRMLAVFVLPSVASIAFDIRLINTCWT